MVLEREFQRVTISGEEKCGVSVDRAVGPSGRPQRAPPARGAGVALERAFLFPALEGRRVCGNELVCWELRRVSVSGVEASGTRCQEARPGADRGE